MSYFVFADNFRGFSSTSVEIKPVNFLVGENSTGKTSLLALLKILSGPELLFGQRFDDQVGVGRFSDIVSSHSTDKTYFRIGAAWEQPAGKQQKPTVIGYLFTFKDKEGRPEIAKCTYYRAGTKISLRLGKNLEYVEERFDEDSAKELMRLMCSKGVREHAEDALPYAKFKLPGEISGTIPIFMALSFIWNRARLKEGISNFALDPNDVDFLPTLTWLAPIRTKAKRTYDQLSQALFTPEGEHTPFLIRKTLRSKSSAEAFRKSLETIGKSSGLFQEVRTKDFGRGSDAPFELDVVLEGKAINITNVGYGVSQALPLVVEALLRRHNSWIAIQQPEIHLHPRAQAALGDLFFQLAAEEHKYFMLETHSDFMLDRFRLNYKSQKKDKPASQILFFERKGSRNIVTPLPIGPGGELPADQPESYRKFFIREQIDLLGI
jgi:predicted ATPase